MTGCDKCPHDGAIIRHDAAIDQMSGMKSLAWALWTILAGGLGVVIIRVFQIVH